MQAAFEIIKQLVADFKAQESAYLSPSYQESQIRQDFIDKFFTALGWDVAHNIQKNPYQQEVHIENKVHMAGSQRRADYAFFFAPNFRDPKFFVEAKKPSRNLANPDDYYQTIRYGWNANTPIAILTDFEEFHILDCRYKPNIKDVMSQKIEYFHYSDYTNEEKFSRIYWLFSHEAVASGSIEKRVAELPKPRGKAIQRGLFKGGYQPVDEAFLEELDEYRKVLAKSFKKSNPDLQSEELTEAVQRTIDRLVFIRFLEDKQIEEPEIINLRSKKSVWKGFLALCRQLDPKYNGLVFKPHKLLDGKDFNPPDDEEFVRICDELADPSSPYNFDQIPISILGSIYERFLGKVVVATDKRATVEEKPEVRKAGGIYYTPVYIVRYIVNETVGKLIEGKTPEVIAQMTFADIACGSGSFLIEVYNQLLDYHIRFYIANPAKHKEADVFERDGKLHLTVKKKKEILLNNIFGVDIDFQATEVTQLSLYLKLLEDVTMHDAHQFGMFKETILPDLKQNILCGNSLIGTNIGGLFMDDGSKDLKPLNFEDAFLKIMKKGGFDAIVGNPPYVRIQSTSEKEINYYNDNFRTAIGNYDIYCLFIEKAFDSLNSKGMFGYIVPHRFMKTDYGEGLRKYLSSKKSLRKIIDFDGYMVFEQASINTAILILSKKTNSIFSFGRFINPKITQGEVIDLLNNNKNEVNDNPLFTLDSVTQENLSSEPWVFFWKKEESVKDKLFKCQEKLGDITTHIFQGLKTGSDPIFIGIPIEKKAKSLVMQFENGEIAEIEKDLMKPLIKGGEMQRYNVGNTNRMILFPYENGSLINQDRMKNKYPYAQKYFDKLRTSLSKRENGKMKGKDWYGYTRNQALTTMFLPKIVTPDYYAHSSYAYDQEGKFFFCGGGAGGYGIVLKQGINFKFILGLLNSRILDWYLHKISLRAYQTAYMYVKKYIEQLPIRIINFDDPQDRFRHDNIVRLVEQILEAKEKLGNAKTEAETNRFELLCQTLDRQIDERVYELYGLTEEEIKIVEGK